LEHIGISEQIYRRHQCLLIAAKKNY